MTDVALVANETIGTADTIEALYTSPTSGLGTVIRALTVTNNSTASASYKAYIFTASGAIQGAICPLKVVVRDRFDSAASAVNQVIPPGGTLRVENSTENALSFYMTGLEQ